ncbi:uncharacterized protein LOC124140750 [Haliotis rufescens]|uniref:uncharacterized protein LOC124140750 n=1 Tax=Haliotis rufescens TaxID=6454 RepID=UPI00201E7C72|nr:uncharacterized protein LOC124140750 [Haliotis rufescens]
MVIRMCFNNKSLFGACKRIHSGSKAELRAPQRKYELLRKEKRFQFSIKTTQFVHKTAMNSMRYLSRGRVLLLVMALSCAAEDKDVYFDTFANCAQTNTVDYTSQVTVQAERNPEMASNSFSACEILFRASGPDDALCLQIDQLYFKNRDLKLNYYDAQEAAGNTPNRVFSDDTSDTFSVPMEICTTGRYASLALKPNVTGGAIASIKDIDINIKVRNMHGSRRTVYMDTDCGAVSGRREVDESQTVVVMNRHADRTADLPGVCQAVFKYTGEDKNKTVCLQYLQKEQYCNYKLKVLDGNLTTFAESHTYSCTSSEPKMWCSKGSYLTLELTREATLTASLEPADLFTVNVKDGVSGQNSETTTGNYKGPTSSTVFPDEPKPDGGLSWWVIALIVVGAIIVILVPVVFCCVKKSKVATVGV